MASGVFNSGSTGIADGSIDYLNDTIKVMLVTDGYTFNADHDDIDAVIAGEELTVSGYAGGFSGAGRKTLGSKTVTNDTTNDRTKFDAADPTAWTLATGEDVKAAIVYKHDTDDATSIPIFYQEFAAPIPTNGGTFTLSFHADGIDYIQNG